MRDSISDRFGDALRYPVTNAEVLPLIKGPGGVISGTSVNPEFPHPYSLQWTFGVQREIGADWALDTSYVGNHGVKLNMVRFINQPDRISGARPFTGFGQFRFYDTSESSTFNSWQTSIKKRFAEGFGLGFYYTWARSLSYTNDADLLLPTSPQDLNNIAADRGPTPFDINHRFNSDFIYELPFKRLSSGSRAQELLLAGWTVSGIFSAQTGQPLWVRDDAGGLQGARPDYIGGAATFDNSRDTLIHINAAAFPRVSNGEFSGVAIRPGTIGRNAIRHNGFWNIDLSLAKNFHTTESTTVQFRADMINAFNHTVLNAPESRINRGSFGLFRSTRGARVTQFQLRFTF